MTKVRQKNAAPVDALIARQLGDLRSRVSEAIVWALPALPSDEQRAIFLRSSFTSADQDRLRDIRARLADEESLPFAAYWRGVADELAVDLGALLRSA